MDGDHSDHEDALRSPLLGFLTDDPGKLGEEEERVAKVLEKSGAHVVTFQDGVVVDMEAPKDLSALVGDVDRSNTTALSRSASHPHDELRWFRNGLRWLGLDQSSKFKVALSWIVFILFTFIVPFVNLTSVSCPDCDSQHRHPFEGLVQVAETSLAAVSFLCLSHTVRRHGLRRTLLLDRIVRDPVEVRTGYESELHSAFSLLASILLPVAVIEIAFRTWWYYYVTVAIPFIESDPRLSLVLNIAFFTSGLLSWLYRTSVFLFTCILFRLMCSLQILRLKGYIKLLGTTPNVSVILTEHMRIRAQLTTISHRFRAFLVLALFTICFSQVWSLFMLLNSYEKVSFFRAGDLVVCSVVQLTGLMLFLNGASTITHRAQRIIGIVSQWHALATCNPNFVTDSQKSGDDPSKWTSIMRGPAHPGVYHDSSEETDSGDDSPRYSSDVDHVIHDMDNFQKRHALLCYLQQAKTGISLYGCVLDRGFLYGMFGCTVSLTLFILGKTVVT